MSSMRSSHAPRVYQLQAVAVLTQANPVSTTKYTVLATTKNVKIFGITVKVTWTVQPTPAEIHLTVDGQDISTDQANPVSTTIYRLRRRTDPAIMYDFTTSATVSTGTIVEGRSVKVEDETTGGTVSEIEGKVWYKKLP